MTVGQVIERLQNISNQGHGEDIVEAWDPDSEDWETVTVLTYSGGMPVRIYTDEP